MPIGKDTHRDGSGRQPRNLDRMAQLLGRQEEVSNEDYDADAQEAEIAGMMQETPANPYLEEDETPGDIYGTGPEDTGASDRYTRNGKPVVMGHGGTVSEGATEALNYVGSFSPNQPGYDYEEHARYAEMPQPWNDEGAAKQHRLANQGDIAIEATRHPLYDGDWDHPDYDIDTESERSKFDSYYGIA